VPQNWTLDLWIARRVYPQVANWGGWFLWLRDPMWGQGVVAWRTSAPVPEFTSRDLSLGILSLHATVDRQRGERRTSFPIEILGTDCSFEATGETREDVKAKAMAHAKEIHGEVLGSMTPEQMAVMDRNLDAAIKPA
jgi:predicted small metal-binding protein